MKDRPFMYDVMIYAAIATVVCVMLYSVLGKQVGNQEDLDPSGMMDSPKPNRPVAVPLSEEESKLGLAAVTALDPSFSSREFIQGANQAYSMILEAYATGDTELLSELLTTDVYAAYAESIADREKAGHTQVTDLGRLRMSSIKSAVVEGSVARIEVLYEADLTSALLDADGTLVKGDPDILLSVSEVWEYERDMKSDDPNWHPTPDTKPA